MANFQDLQNYVQDLESENSDLKEWVRILQAEVWDLRDDCARLLVIERKYRELLRSSCAHGDAMMSSLVSVLLTPGTVEALQGSKGE